MTPNWTVRLPGGEYSGPDPDGYLPRDEIVSHLESWAGSFRAPVRGGHEVIGLEKEDGGFKLRLAGGSLEARTVVVASGAYQRAHRPHGADQLDPALTQILADDYRHPDMLPPGAVLVVGSGQTGCQLAEELHGAGRKVYIACGRAPWAPRRFGGHDLVWWVVRSGFWDRTVRDLPSPAGRLIANILATGHGGGHDLHLRTLQALGVEMLGHFAGAEDGKFRFADDLAASADFGDARLADLWKYIEAYCARTGTPPPDFVPPAPLRLTTRTELDWRKEGIESVIWTSGYRPDYGWVHVPVFDEMGFPIQDEGATEVPGLYFVGVHFLRKLQSSLLYGVGEDAALIADHIQAHRS